MSRTKVIEGLEERKLDLMLDSGAFSAWTRGEVIDVYDYIEFVKAHGDLFTAIVGLDVIPGTYGKRRSVADVERAVAQSKDNLEAMRDAGIKPIPIYHQNENIKHLEDMLANGEDYIGISPSGDAVSMNMPWFKKVFHVITNSEGYPIVKTHGFGVTSVPVMVSFPWYSVDSLSWVMKAAYGCIFVPQQGPGGRPDYSKNPISVWVTGSERKAERFEYENMKGLCVEWVDFYFREILKIDPASIRYSTYARMECMASYFRGVRARLAYAPFKAQSGSLTDRKFSEDSLYWDYKKIIYAVGVMNNVRRSEVLNALDLNSRLLSYYDIRMNSEEELYNYAKYGITHPYKRGNSKMNWSSATYLNRRKINLSDRLQYLKEIDNQEMSGGSEEIA